MSPQTGLTSTGPFILEEGTRLPVLEQRWVRWGPAPDQAEGVILHFHSLTGGPDPGEGWRALVGPGRILDTERFTVLGVSLLGSCSGTTPPPKGARVTPRDMARAVGLLLDQLGVGPVRLATGGSLGGMVTLEWAATFPDRSQAAVVFAAPERATALSLGYNHVQREALALAGEVGLGLARKIAMLTYRTGEELDTRFGMESGADALPHIVSWLDHHGLRLRERFAMESYLHLIGAMDAHDVGRERGGAVSALGAFQGALVGVGIPGDRLFGPEDVLRWTTPSGAAYREIHSPKGHDAFLLEEDQVGRILAEGLEASRRPALTVY